MTYLEHEPEPRWGVDEDSPCPHCGGVNCTGTILTSDIYTSPNTGKRVPIAVTAGYCSNCDIEFVGDRILFGGDGDV